MHMSNEAMPLRKSFIDFFENLSMQLRTALSVGLPANQDAREATSSVNSEFEGWLRNDPMVTENPASRYSDDAPGYLTRNGLGSLEVGAADD